MDSLVSSLLGGASCVAITSIAGPDGRMRAFRTELSTFVLRSTHFWGLSSAVLRPNHDNTALVPGLFVHSNCFPDIEPSVIDAVDTYDGAERSFALSRGERGNGSRFVITDDYEPIWSFAAGDDPAVLGEVVAEARDIKVALCLGGDLWLVQRCVLPQFMKENRYFRLSTPEGRIPFFMTWERQQLEPYLQEPGANARIDATTFQAGTVIFSNHKFIWFNSPSAGVEREYQELRLFASRKRPQMNFGGV